MNRVNLVSEIICPTCGGKHFSFSKKDVWYVEKNKILTSVKKKVCNFCKTTILYNFAPLSFTVYNDIGFDRFLKRLINDHCEEVIFDYDFNGGINYNRRQWCQ